MSSMEFFQALGALFIGGGLLLRGRANASAAPAAPMVAPEDSNETFLKTEEYNKFAAQASNMVILGQQAEQEVFVKKLPNGNIMTIKSHGAYLVTDSQGNVFKSRDALGVVREYQRDAKTNELMVRRFGVWTSPPNASVDADGVLSWSDGVNEFKEMLDGTFIHHNNASGTTIITDKLNGTETVQRQDGQTWRQTSSEQGEESTIWDNGNLIFNSFTYKEGGTKQAITRQGTITCRNVYRYESHHLAGVVQSESFAFTNPRGGKPARMRIELTTGALLLKNLSSIETKMEKGQPAMTTYNLSVPTTFSLDIPKHKGILDGIVKINSQLVNGHEALVFVSDRSDEYVIFPGKLDEDKAHEVFHSVRKMQDAGSEIPDLYLR